MDPSEYDGTIEKNPESMMDAGVLENFLQYTQPKEFVALDLSKECGDIYVSSYNLKEIGYLQFKVYS